MLTVLIRYKGNNVKRFANEMISSGIVDEIRNEEGNIRYDYFLPLDDNDSLLLIDSWQNQEALDKHHQHPVMKKIMLLREKYDLHMEVEKYNSVTSSSDEQYIRK